MLKAYSYIEMEHLDASVIDHDVLEEEKRIISEFVKDNPTKEVGNRCVVCGASTCKFAVINEVRYSRCEQCLSIFAPVEKGTLKRYKEYKPLAEFRTSDKYQKSVNEKRMFLWDDMLFWMEYRLARYGDSTSAFDIIDVENRYDALAKRVKQTSFCKSYNVVELADLVLYLDKFRCEADPIGMLAKLNSMLKNNGILILSTRVGSGFDMLTLKGRVDTIYPYENIFLPSIEGLEILLEKTGFDVLEITTPGSLDIEHVIRNRDKLDPNDYFIQYLISKNDREILAEFQRFLQKCGMSSYARIIARKHL